MNIIGEVNRRNVLLLDDMIDTAGTVTQGASALRDKGAKTILAGCTHAVLSGPALDRINASPLDTLVVTNTLPLNGKEDLCRKLVSLTVAPLLGEAIKRIHEEESVSSLFV
jgi:ribose-phosphate pyrophosphokinase